MHQYYICSNLKIEFKPYGTKKNKTKQVKTNTNVLLRQNLASH